MADGYVLLTLGGVQAFIAASRRTADLWTSSRLMSRLCQQAVGAVVAAGGTPVLPSSAASPDGLPNRVFAVVEDGDPEQVAKAASAAVASEWARLSSIIFGDSPSEAVAEALATMPVLRWATWSGAAGPTANDGESGRDLGYDLGWNICQRASVARKRVRSFEAYVGRGLQPCSLCGVREGNGRRETTMSGTAGGTRFPARLRLAPGERLCAVCAVKRSPGVTDDLAGDRAAFPSTASIATAPFRLSVVDLLSENGESSDLSRAVFAHETAVDGVVAALRAVGADEATASVRPGTMPVLEAAASRVSEPVARWARIEGSWLLPDTWQAASLIHEHRLRLVDGDSRLTAMEQACRQGRRALSELTKAAIEAADRHSSKHGAEIESSVPEGAKRKAAAVARSVASGAGAYLALVVQDADNMGRSLAPERAPAGVSARDWHLAVSSMLVEVAGAQSAVFEDLSGRAVYAGGDDLLGMIPARHAIDAAARCRDVFLGQAAGLLRRPSVSTAVVFFHASYPLQDALARARQALDAEAKALPTKAGLTLVVLRRGGETASATVPWEGRDASNAARSVEALAAAFRSGVSPNLAFDLYGSRRGIAELSDAGLDYGAEVGRLVARHCGEKSDAPRVLALVRALEPMVDRLGLADVEAWVGVLNVARFAASEAR